MRLGQLHDTADGGRHVLPGTGLDCQLPAAGRGEPRVFGPPAQLRDAPLGVNPATVFESMERWICSR